MGNVKIQHYYTTGSTAPDVDKLEYGEIAIAHEKGGEGIFFKNTQNNIVSPTFSYSSEDDSHLINGSYLKMVTLKHVINRDNTLQTVKLYVDFWNYYINEIQTFLESEDVEGDLDTLNEIREKLNEVGDVSGLLTAIANLETLVGTGFTDNTSLTTKLKEYEKETWTQDTFNGVEYSNLGVHKLYNGDVNNIDDKYKFMAAAIGHRHSNYLTENDLKGEGRSLSFICGSY